MAFWLWGPAGNTYALLGHYGSEAEALEDCLDVDVFSPPREDWLDGTDHYFHQK